ncbi:MAG: chaperone modulator CbpM [Psychromonas sp.]|nr:chaperone modulator CbpM [Psychromonas sp.]
MKRTLSNISLNELCQLDSIEPEIIIEIVQYGIVKPIENAETVDWEFETSSVYWIKKAVQLYQDLEIDWLAVALLIELMQQRDALRKENEAFKKQLKRFIQQ